MLGRIFSFDGWDLYNIISENLTTVPLSDLCQLFHAYLYVLDDLCDGMSFGLKCS